LTLRFEGTVTGGPLADDGLSPSFFLPLSPYHVFFLVLFFFYRYNHESVQSTPLLSFACSSRRASSEESLLKCAPINVGLADTFCFPSSPLGKVSLVFWDSVANPHGALRCGTGDLLLLLPVLCLLSCASVGRHQSNPLFLFGLFPPLRVVPNQSLEFNGPLRAGTIFFVRFPPPFFLRET